MIVTLASISTQRLDFAVQILMCAVAVQPLNRRFTFRFTIAVVMLSLLILSIGTIALISFYFGQRTVESLTEGILQQTLGRVELRVQELTRQALDWNAWHDPIAPQPPVLQGRRSGGGDPREHELAAMRASQG